MTACFYTVYQVNNWYDLAAEFFVTMAKAKFPWPIFVHLISGSAFAAFELESMGGFLGLDVRVTVHAENLCELPALIALWEFAKRPGEVFILYAHAKNVTLKGVYGSKWRWSMMAYTCAAWRERVADLRTHDVSGFCLRNWQGSWIYTGNFWWARGDWLRRLPEPTASADRFDYERWLLSVKGWTGASKMLSDDEMCDNSFYPRHGNPQNAFLDYLADHAR